MSFSQPGEVDDTGGIIYETVGKVVVFTEGLPFVKVCGEPLIMEADDCLIKDGLRMVLVRETDDGRNMRKVEVLGGKQPA